MDGSTETTTDGAVAPAGDIAMSTIQVAAEARKAIALLVALMPHLWCNLARFVGPSSDCAEGDRRGKLVGSTSVGLTAAPSDRSHRLDATAGPPRAQSMGASRGR